MKKEKNNKSRVAEKIATQQLTYEILRALAMYERAISSKRRVTKRLANYNDI